MERDQVTEIARLKRQLAEQAEELAIRCHSTHRPGHSVLFCDLPVTVEQAGPDMQYEQHRNMYRG